MTVMKQHRGLAAAWTSNDPVLAAGEIGIESDTNKCKFGNGANTWSELPYAIGGAGGAGTITKVNGDDGPEVVLDYTDVGADPAGAGDAAVEGIPPIGSSNDAKLSFSTGGTPLETTADVDRLVAPTPKAKKTANFTFAVDDFIEIDTSAGAVTGTLPAAPPDGSIVAFKLQTAGNTFTYQRGGSDTIIGGVTSVQLTVAGSWTLAVYRASTTQWLTFSGASFAAMMLVFAQLTGAVLANASVAADPTTALGIASKQYVDNLGAGAKIKQEADTISLVNIALTGEQALNGVTTSASRVLAVGQTAQAQNGVWVSGAGAWTRATDCDTSAELTAASVTIGANSTKAGDKYQQQTLNPVVGADPIVWVKSDSLAGVERTTNKNIASGYAGLDAGGLLLAALVPQLAQTKITGLVAAIAALAPLADPVFTGAPQAPQYAVSGIPGVSGPGRYRGTLAAFTNPTGAHLVGDWYLLLDGAFVQNGGIVYCRVAGNPGLHEVILSATATQDAIATAIAAQPELASSDPAKIAFDSAGGITTADVTNVETPAQFTRLGANLIVANNSVVFADVLVLPVAAATTYEGRARLVYSADPAADCKLQFTCTTGGAAALQWSVVGPDVNAATPATIVSIPRRVRNIGDQEIVGGIGANAATNGVVAEISFILTTDVGGNLRLRAAQNVAVASNLIAIAGSTMILRKVA